jgi:undecaprenyl pyrophosphate phosphatase UppP
MKLGRLFILGIAAILAVAAAIAAVVYFKDEILEILADIRKSLDQKTTKIFHNSEYTDYADI